MKYEIGLMVQVLLPVVNFFTGKLTGVMQRHMLGYPCELAIASLAERYDTARRQGGLAKPCVSPVGK